MGQGLPGKKPLAGGAVGAGHALDVSRSQQRFFPSAASLRGPLEFSEDHSPYT